MSFQSLTLRLLLLLQKSGKVDQSGCMLSDDVTELGYTLLCVATPKEDCKVDIISEVSAGCSAMRPLTG